MHWKSLGFLMVCLSITASLITWDDFIFGGRAEKLSEFLIGLTLQFESTYKALINHMSARIVLWSPLACLMLLTIAVYTSVKLKKAKLIGYRLIEYGISCIDTIIKYNNHVLDNGGEINIDEHINNVNKIGDDLDRNKVERVMQAVLARKNYTFTSGFAEEATALIKSVLEPMLSDYFSCKQNIMVAFIATDIEEKTGVLKVVMPYFDKKSYRKYQSEIEQASLENIFLKEEGVHKILGKGCPDDIRLMIRSCSPDRQLYDFERDFNCRIIVPVRERGDTRNLPELKVYGFLVIYSSNQRKKRRLKKCERTNIANIARTGAHCFSMFCDNFDRQAIRDYANIKSQINELFNGKGANELSTPVVPTNQGGS